VKNSPSARYFPPPKASANLFLQRLTFTRTLPKPVPAEGVTFPLSIFYDQSASSQGLSTGTDPLIGNWVIKGIKSFEHVDAEKVMIKVMVGLSADGIVVVDRAEVWEEVMVDDVPKEKDSKDAKEEESMDTKEEPKKKKVVKKHPLTVTETTHHITPHLLQSHRDLEATMIMSDKLIIDTEYAKNALEEYVYETRSKLESSWESYCLAADREALKKKCDAAEEWLYSEEGEDAQKSVYVSKLKELKELGDPIAKRYRVYETLPRHLSQLVSHAQTLALSLADEKLSWIPAEDLEKAKELCQSKISFAEGVLKDIKTKKETDSLHVDIDTSVEKVDRERELLDAAVLPVINRVKPKPKEEPKEEAPAPENKDAKEPEAKKDEMEID
jgi:heat shock protein 4